MNKKPLPSLVGPVLTCDLPISGQKVKYRPFVVKEQKALLLAQESNDTETIFNTIKSVILSCTDNTLDFSKVPIADLSYFFLQLRIASVGPEIDFVIPCESCEEPIDVRLMLDEIKIEKSDVPLEVKITPTVGIVFRYPTLEDSFNVEADSDSSVAMIYRLIDAVYDDDQVFSKSDYTEEEFREWLLTMNDKQAGEIDKFINSIPELQHDMHFDCPKCGTKQSRSLVGLQSFFRLGITA